MTDALDIALAQINVTVGDIAGNAAKIRAARAEAAQAGAHLMLTTELALCGYPPEDLVLKPAFLDRRRKRRARDMANDTVRWRAGGSSGASLAAGRQGPQRRRPAGRRRASRHSSINTICRITAFSTKSACSGRAPCPIRSSFCGIRLGVMICEDMWAPAAAGNLQAKGAEILLVPNGSPFEMDKEGTRLSLAEKRVGETGLPLIYANQVGGQDELVFDGSSFALNHDGKIGDPARVVAGVGDARQTAPPAGWPLRVRAGPDGAVSGRFAGDLRRHDARPQGLRRQEPLPRRHSRHVRRHRQRADGGRRGRCARRRQGAARDDAVALYQPGEHRRRGGLRGAPRRQDRKRGD